MLQICSGQTCTSEYSKLCNEILCPVNFILVHPDAYLIVDSAKYQDEFEFNTFSSWFDDKNSCVLTIRLEKWVQVNLLFQVLVSPAIHILLSFFYARQAPTTVRTPGKTSSYLHKTNVIQVGGRNHPS